ncbi:MAG TPA: excinuclease ABC subunit B, partial [Opitutaceae bacterium]|nr:excinuclease ABC subunit B [Opitutaceae bacterium]
MPSSLKCDLCGKPATVHLTQIVNNKVHKVDLCEECAQAKGVTDTSGFSLADLLIKASLNPEPDGNEIRCEQCGFTQSDFKKQGRFGCPACY